MELYILYHRSLRESTTIDKRHVIWCINDLYSDKYSIVGSFSNVGHVVTTVNELPIIVGLPSNAGSIIHA